MEKVIDDLRKKINEDDEEENILRDSGISPTDKPKEKDEDEGNVKFEVNNMALKALGFKSNLKYRPKARLRKLCSRFLRVSYLVDFLSIEALSDIYILSIRDLTDTLKTLSSLPCNYEFVKPEEH